MKIRTLLARLQMSSLAMAMSIGTTFTLGISLGDQAEAASCGACISAVNRAHRKTQRIIEDEHDATRETVEEEIRRQTLELIEAMRRQTAETGSRTDRTIEAARRISDAEQQNETFRQRQQFRAEAESGMYDPNPFICSLLDLFNSESAGAGASAQGSEIINNRSAYYAGNGRLADAVQEGGVTLATALSNERERLEQELGQGGRGLSNYPTTDFSIIFRSPTVDVEDASIRDAIEYQLTNLWGPPPRPLTEEMLNTPQGKAESLRRDRVMAIQHAAEQSIAFAMNMRTPIKDSTEERQKFGDVYGEENIPERISELQQIDMRVVDHYAMTEERMRLLSDMNEKALLTEIITQMSILNRMTYLQLEMEQRNGTTLAAIAAGVSPSVSNVNR